MKYLLILALLLGTLLSPSVAVSASEEYSIQWGNTSEEITLQDKIRIGCQHFGCDVDLVTFVAKCESTNRMIWDASGRYFGIFQYVPSTFNAYSMEAFSSLLGETPDRSKINMYSESHQVLTTTWAFSHGKQGAWGCYWKYR